ncbi:hypothetical protein EEL32_09695 [Brevibacillus laterosporus]|nr:RICIN domain-containing protein [Brevibacillus laterosporus]TPG70785.1 hypothetical protein EEL31_21615 [Brevibacillus laterosporus]TPG88411.1 hypothetical protein EEL32_09695 [Brevibacillus laterosporus]
MDTNFFYKIKNSDYKTVWDIFPKINILDGNGNTITLKEPIGDNTESNKPSQEWILQEVAEKTYAVMNKSNGQALTVCKIPFRSYRIELRPWANSSLQMWMLLENDDSKFSIMNLETKKMAVPGIDDVFGRPGSIILEYVPDNKEKTDYWCLEKVESIPSPPRSY